MNDTITILLALDNIDEAVCATLNSIDNDGCTRLSLGDLKADLELIAQLQVVKEALDVASELVAARIAKAS